MSTPQITLTDCLDEVNNALNYWYPLPVRDSKLDEELGSYRPYGASQAECDARHVRLFQFRDRLQQQLKAAGKSAAFDLATAMAELANVAAEREKLRILHRDAVDGWNKAALERDNARLHLASLQSCLNSAAKSVRESEIAANNARQSLRAAEQDCDETDSINADLRTVNARLVADLAAAMQRADTAEAILRAKA